MKKEVLIALSLLCFSSVNGATDDAWEKESEYFEQSSLGEEGLVGEGQIENNNEKGENSEVEDQKKFPSSLLSDAKEPLKEI